MRLASNECSLVLMYHRLGNPLEHRKFREHYLHPALFRGQLRTFAALGYQPATLLQIATDPACRTGHYCLTFDDAYACVYQYAFPILRAQGIPATIFPVISAMGGTNSWDVRKGDEPQPIMTMENLRELHDAGWEVAAHTMEHPTLTEINDVQLQAELQQGKRYLEDFFGHSIPGFAYPYGGYDERVRTAVIDAGYQYAAATTRGVVTPDTDIFALPRINMRYDSFGIMLCMKISKAQRLTAERNRT
ncbi:MAG: polysaccharide deacetylase family protein [bacterium]